MHPDGPVLVTGASGFIGTRLIERLIIEHGIPVRGLVHSLSHAVRLGRLSAVEIVTGDIADADVVDRAVRGCSAIIHCAYDPSGSTVNRRGAELLAAAAVRSGVHRFIHLSSMSVYEPLDGTTLDESTSAVPCGWSYADTKLLVERVLLDFQTTRGLPLVILQPTIVHGPFSGAWTIRIADMLRTARVVLPSTNGICNHLYIDDLVDAIRLALTTKAIESGRFLISGRDTIGWHEYFGAYETVLGTNSLIIAPGGAVEDGAGASIRSYIKDPVRLMKSPTFSNVTAGIAGALGPRLTGRLKAHLPVQTIYPDNQQLALYSAMATADCSHAQVALGYTPQFRFSDAMDVTRDFLSWFYAKRAAE